MPSTRPQGDRGSAVATTPTGLPPEPSRQGVSSGWQHRALYERVLDAIRALPNHFETPLFIEGVPASDLFTLNSALGASIESAMVDCLNNLREVWDPDGAYKLYRFVRQPQAFPDVRLQRNDGGTDPILMGIELKGWFVLSKEGEPSFRYKVSPEACAPQDLLVIVPWIFKNVISGQPILLTPLVEEARFAAQRRNYHWQYLRQTDDPQDQRGVTLSAHRTPYPIKADRSSDTPIRDGGSNFGRIARSGILELNSGVNATMQAEVAGVPIHAWHQFLSIFTQTDESYAEALATLGARLSADKSLTHEQRLGIAACLRELAQKLEVAPQPPATASERRRAYKKP